MNEIFNAAGAILLSYFALVGFLTHIDFFTRDEKP